MNSPAMREHICGVYFCQLLLRAVCADYHFPPVHETGVYKSIERAERHGGYHLRAEVVKDHQIAALHAPHAQRGGLAVLGIAPELCALIALERGGRAVIAYREALFGDDAGDAGREVGFPQARAALEQQVRGDVREALGISAAALEHECHDLARRGLHGGVKGLRIQTQVELFKALVPVLHERTELLCKLTVIEPLKAGADAALVYAGVPAFGTGVDRVEVFRLVAKFIQKLCARI